MIPALVSQVYLIFAKQQLIVMKGLLNRLYVFRTRDLFIARGERHGASRIFDEIPREALLSHAMRSLFQSF